LVRVLGEAHRDPTCNTLVGPSNWQPKTTTKDNKLKYEEDPRSKQTSSALTENLHPGYPYRENLGENDDLPIRSYPWPYLATQTDRVSGYKEKKKREVYHTTREH
jgi:hypothetical protein